VIKMPSVIKLLGVESDLTTASNVGLSTLVRVHNTSAGEILMTQKNAAAATIASVTVVAGEVIVIEKSPTDTVEGGADLLSVGVAYR